MDWLEVLVDCGYTQGLFTYGVPLELAVVPGDIVLVGFGAQQVGAIAIRFIAKLPQGLDPEQIRPVQGIIARGFFSPHYWQLLLRVAQAYQTDMMTVVRMALPPGLLRRSQPRVRLLKTDLASIDIDFLPPTAQQLFQLLQRGSTQDYSVKYLQRQIKSVYRGIQELEKAGLAERYLATPQVIHGQRQKWVSYVSEREGLTKRQREILLVLRHEGGEMWLSELVGVAKTTATTVTKMAKVGCVAIAEREKLRLHQSPSQGVDPAKTLTNAQQAALETIKKIQGYGEVLLHGVTGSGKTEVYLQAIAPLLSQQKSALVLVPEIGLTPQLMDRFRSRFGDRVLTYHSGLSAGERYDTWRQMLRPDSQIIIGTRSAVFAPLPNLGMIILDEEHDSSYKQDQPAPTYHARTVARWRSQQENCPLLLGSATPALDTWVEFQTAQNSNYYYISLPERVYARPLPPVEIVDMRHELRVGNRSLFSQSLRQALERITQTHEQGILFIARRGHSTFVSCRSCGYVMECPHCDVSLSYHYVQEGSLPLLRCHYCDHSQIQPKHCPSCNSPYFKFFGNGTQKVFQALQKEFPQLRCLRFDSDTTRRKGAHRDLLGQFARGEADILLGTQMLTKGLDVAQVTLVGVIAADGLLHQSDYRAAERTFQTLTQVAGRAGRGDEPGQVIIQTYSPEHPVIQAVKTHDYLTFAEREISQRQELDYPPFGKLILLRFSGENHDQVRYTAEAIAEKCFPLLEPEDELLGPVPANILRVARRYRWQVVLKFPQRKTEIPDLTFLREFCPRPVSLSINVDPLYID
ncbi:MULTISPECIES: primosomal protein N' [Cyanophyceae]|uniref:primosomal protein N' n=1 Tax=Cyanophyceae TaxID=3028117 RepID=UPI00016DC5E3|nr:MULTISPECIES: primosomal protein N' [Cyanophyceae]ACA98375.1 primosomal protein N' (replication factor Y) [Picosynechococcus sp. PCC 7002]SMH46312.1 replication restart DNA helicase PriA [Picosynechococcus sp. OG1]SMQ80640.1 replication restart DNA helicase PriA [Synechococcus sp. 7002]